ncbi:MAG: chemotaxis protein CheW, partial [Eubacteriales bacterium]|nr:chemotaxis protein CheW [Eubacteriales bacterium]
MIRNAIDHGIESREDRLATGKPEAGTLLLRAFHQENHIVIRVQDDGRGLNLERIKAKAIERGLLKADVANRLTDQEIIGFSYMAGFSTAAEVSDLSGRGVGLDVVKTQIEQVNGSVEIGSTPGQGTSCTIKLPLTLAIIKALMVALGDQVYAFPLAHVVETVQISREEIQLLKHSEVVVVRGMVLPLVRLSRIFAQSETNTEKIYVVIVGTSENQVGVIVDRLIGEQEIVIKSLGVHLGRVTGISGATILGDGRVSLIVDVRALASETAGTRAKARAV